MLKDDEGKGSCGKTAWRVKRNYITRQSGKNGCTQSIRKRKILNESVNGIINNVCKLGLNEGKNGKHGVNSNANKLSLQSDAKNAIIHSFTNVKAPVFKYSKCRTCRIPCSGDIFKNGKFEVNVKKLSISECLKFREFGDGKRKNKVNHLSKKVNDVYNKDCDNPHLHNGDNDCDNPHLHNGDNDCDNPHLHNGDNDCDDGSDHIKNNDTNDMNDDKIGLNDEERDLIINGIHDLTDGCKDLRNGELDLSGEVVDSPNQDGVVENGVHNSNEVITLNDGDGDLIDEVVSDTSKVNSNVNDEKVDFVITSDDHSLNNGDRDSVEGKIDDLKDDCLDDVNDDLIIKGICDLNEVNGSFIMKSIHGLSNGDNEIISNGIHDLKNGVICLNDGDKDLNEAAANIKKCVGDLRNNQFKTSSSIINDENIFSMVLRSHKCMINKDNTKCKDTKNLISDIKNISKSLQSTKKHILNSRKFDTVTNIVGKENKSIINCQSSSKNSAEIPECDTEVHENDILIREESACITDTDSMPSQEIQLNSAVDVCTKKCESYNEKEKDQTLPSTSFSDKNDNCMKTSSKNVPHLQEDISESDTTNVNHSGDLHKKNGIMECIKTGLANKYKENDIVCNQEVTYEDGVHTSKNQGCKCGANFPACSRCIVDLNRNVNSEFCREHNLRHNRKHVRLKEIMEKHLDTTSNDLFEEEVITSYIFESTRRLKFLHNHFYTSIVKPDEDILQCILDNIEIDIEILDEDRLQDRLVSIAEGDGYGKNNQEESCLRKEESNCTLSKCEWDDCDMQFNDSMKLLDHLKANHVNNVTSDRTLVSCLWRKCKFSNQNCSYKWLSNHIMKHCSVHPFKCVILGCELSFATQSGLARHVPSHFNEGKVRRTCVTTGVGKENGKTKYDITSNFIENGSENEEVGEPARKKAKYEKFVDRYKATCAVNNNVQSGINGIKYKLQISTSNSSLNCGFVGRQFRFNHKVIGKRTLKDGSTEMLLSPSSTKIFPYKSFWFDGNSLAKQKSLYVDISVNNLSDDVKQHIYDNEQISRVKTKEKRGM